MKRAKKILLWTGIGAGTLAAILLIFSACYGWIIGKQLEKKLAALKAAGEPICLADLARKPIPPEQNAVTYLLRAKDDMNAVVNAVFDLKSLWVNESGYEPEDMKKTKATLEAYPRIYPILRQAAASPEFNLPLDYAQGPRFIDSLLNDDFVPLRNTARYLYVKTTSLIYQGNRDEAVEVVILMLHLSRLAEREPLLNNYLVTRAVETIALGCANDVLQSGPISEQSRADLDKELSLHGSMEIVRHALKTERAFSIDQISKFPWSLSSYHWQLGVLNAYEECLNYSLKPYSDWANEEDPNGAPEINFNTLGELLKPALRGALISTYRIQACVRAVRIINALQVKVPADSNKIPTMAELGLPDEVGVDPFNGKPMIIKKLPKGWLVYSVGKNLKDDGGIFDTSGENRLPDVGFGPKSLVKEMEEKDLPKENAQSPGGTTYNSQGR